MQDRGTTAVRILAHCRQVAGFLALLSLLFTSLNTSAQSTAWQSTDEVKAAAERYVRQTIGASDDRVVVRAGHLDTRLQLAECSDALSPYLHGNRKTSGRIIVGVRCRGDKPWNIYLPVQVSVMEDVVVAAHPLPRDHRLEASDLAVERLDVSALYSGYVTDANELVGQRLKRSVGKGIALTPTQVEPEILIERGQTVTLLVETPAINISMAGKALMDGAENQRIRVENLGSGRIVEGVVRSAEHVQVALQ